MNQICMKLPEGKTRLDLVREGLAAGLKKQGRLIVSVDKLAEDHRNERRTFRNMDGLIASIKAVGLVEPITVTPEGESGYRIVTGHRRFRAAKAAGLKQVEVLIREPDDALTRRAKSIVSNVQREDVGPVEMAEALLSLLDEDPRIKTQDELGTLIGKDKTWVSRMLRILDLPVELQRKVATSQLSIPYDAVASVARLTNTKHQDELIEALVTGATNRDIRERINSNKGKPAREQIAKPKPKRVFHTVHKVTVVVQATSSKLTNEQCVDALREALKQANR
jgi:ParB family chromosome partitioning protein